MKEKNYIIIYTVALFVLTFSLLVYSITESTYLAFVNNNINELREKYFKSVKQNYLASASANRLIVLDKSTNPANLVAPRSTSSELAFRVNKCKTKDGLDCDWCSTDYAHVENGKIKLKRCTDVLDPMSDANPIVDDIYILSNLLNVQYKTLYKFLCSHKDPKFPADRKNKILSYIDKLPEERKAKAVDAFNNVLKNKLKYLKVIDKEANYENYKSCDFKGVVSCVLKPDAASLLDKYQSCLRKSSSSNGLIFVSNSNEGSCQKYLNDPIFSCIAKDKKSGSTSSATTPQVSSKSSSDGVRISVPPSAPTPPPTPQTSPYTPPYNYNQYNPYNRAPYYPFWTQNYDPCKDPTFAQRNNMGLFTSFMFGVSCLFTQNERNNNNNTNNYNNQQQRQINCTAYVDKDTIQRGETVRLSWNATGASSVSIESTDITKTSLPPKGEIIVSPSVSTKYKITAQNGSSKATCYASVTVENPGAAKLICKPAIIQKGQTAQISWSCPESYTLVDNNFGADSSSGSKPVTLEESQSFNLKCKKGEYEETASCTIQVVEPQLEFVVFPNTVKKGDRIRLSWASLFMDSCEATGPYGFNYSIKNASILAVPFPMDDRAVSGDTKEYTVKCKDSWGTIHTKSVIVTLNDPNATYFDEEQSNNSDNTSGKIVSKTSLNPKECPHFTKYLKVGDIDDEVKKIQIFLKDQGLYYGPINGVFGSDLQEAIKAFQAKYADEILKPWGLSEPTGYWYKTTRKKANYLAGCSEGAIVLDDGTVVY